MLVTECHQRLLPLYQRKHLHRGMDGGIVVAMKLLELEGRAHLEWVSESEGPKFKEMVTKFVEQIRALDPCPLRVE